MNFTPALEKLYQSLQKAALPGIWSKGVALSREKAVLQDSVKPDEWIFRVRVPNRPVSPKVTLWPEDEDSYCDCGDRNEPCLHIVAAIVALKNGSVLSLSDLRPETPLASHIQYRFLRQDGALALERWLCWGERRELLSQSLVGFIGGISSGRIAAPPLSATQEDFTIDQLLSGPSRAPLPRETLGRILKILQDVPHLEFDGKPIRASGQPTGLSARVTDENGGFRIHGVRDESITETFRNGAALCGEQLRPVLDPGLSSEERELLTRTGKFFPAAQVAELATAILPALERKIPIELQTRRLPKVRSVEPRILLRTDSEGAETLSVFPVLVYGDPPIAEIHQDRVHPLSADEIPARDPALERQLARRLQTELNLQPSHRVRFQGAAAVEFLRQSRDWAATGEGTRAFALTGPLRPRLEIHEAGGVTGFTLSFTSSPTDSPADSGAGGASLERVFAAWERGESYIPLLGGGYAPLPLDWLTRYGSRVLALLEAKAATKATVKSQELPPHLLPELAELAEDLGSAIPAGLRKLRAALEKQEGIPELALPSDLRAELRHYQRAGVNWLGFLREAGLGAMLADDMGLGKTLQALSAVRGRTLVISPTSVLQAWAEQIEQFRPGLPYHIYHGAERELADTLASDASDTIVLTTYGVLRLDQEHLSATEWDTVILDEAQTIRNPESQIAQAAHRLRGRFRIALSGTPVENRLTDLWSQFQFLNPGLLGSRSQFSERYAAPLARGDAPAAAELKRRIRPFVLRRLKTEVAPELPPRIETTLHCELSAEERALYESIRAASRGEVLEKLQDHGAGAVLAALEALLRLRQACCHPALVPGSNGFPATSSKVELLLQTLENSIAQGHRALIFSQWTSYLDRIGEALQGSGIAYLRLDGSTRDREAVVTAFQAPDGPPAMLISLKAGGVGITLTAADHVFIMDPWWNPAAEAQAADRAHRIGQENPVLIHRLVARDTVEDRILALQKAKRQLAGAVLDEGAAVPFDRDDILRLLEA